MPASLRIRQGVRHTNTWLQGIALLILATTSAWGNIATDVTVSANRSSLSSNITSPAFSTASANELLLAFVTSDATSSGVAVTSVTGAGLPWTLICRTNVQLGTAEIWRAFAPNRLTDVTVLADLSQSIAASITVVTFTGVDTTGTNGSGAIGATGSGNANPGAPAASLVTTRDNSWVFGVGNDWDSAIARTVPTNQTMVNQYLATVGDTYWVQRQNAPTPTSGTTVTINDTAPTTDRYNLTIVEVLPPAISGTTYTVSGAIPPASLGSGSTVTLSQSGTTVSTATADENGNYSFTGSTNGSYTVTPVKAGITFSPTTQTVTVNGSNATVATFIATATISDTISPASSGAGTLLVLNGQNLTLSKTADSSGSYSFTGLQPDTYTVTPSKKGYTFTPSSRIATITSGSVTANFTASSSSTDLTIDGEQRFQTMDGMGVNINVNSWNNGLLKPALDFLIETNGSTQFRVIRDPMDWVASESLIPALHALDPAVLQQVYETAKMQDIWNTIGYLNQRGIRGGQIILNFMGWTPTWIGGSGAYRSASYITEGREQEFATMVASLVYYGKTVKGLDFTYLSPLNEEDWDCREGPCVDSTQYTTILHYLANELASMGVAGVRFVAPETASVGASATYISQMMADSTIAGATDHLALHDYSGVPISPGTAYPGKNYWVTETSAWCSSCDAGGSGPANEWNFATQTSDIILGDIKNGMAAVLLWEGYDSFWYHHNASSLWGLLAYDSITGLYTPRKRAYAYAQFNRFIEAGDVVIGSRGSIARVPTIIAVYNPATGKVAITGRNSGKSQITISCELANLPTVSTLTLYETGPSVNLSRTGDVSVVGGFFTARISANSIFTLTNHPITP